MEKRNTIIAIVLIVIVVAGMFLYARMKRAEINAPAPEPAATTTDVTPSPYAGITRIDAKHFFDGTTHTVVGSMSMPTPCDLLNWSTHADGSTVTIDFTVINNAEMCAQTVTEARFKVAFDAPENATIKATLEGRPIDVNLIPAAPGETPDDYEIFIKG
ncbi:MAG TPA: hypothetical protein VFS75_02425 [Candidatus Paceibacterota bacterium]|nr:hypothetical protein [Candidatus Paceibacterota bacterium]